MTSILWASSGWRRHPLGPEGRYQVQASGSDGSQGPLSDVAIGRRTAPAIVRYEIEITAANALPAWVLTSDIETSWTHETPPRARLETGTIVASQGAHRASVRLQAEGVVLHEPALVRYRVRGVLADATVTPLSESTQGGLAPPMLEVRWERSDDGPDGTFEVLADSSLSLHDVTAPMDGSPQWYRVKLSAHGVTPFTIEAVAGWRLAFESVTVGGSHACALDTDKRAWCWGNNLSGELGRGFESATAELPAPADLLPPSHRIVAGYGRTCFVDLHGELGCVGGDPLGVSFPATSVEPVSTMLSGVTSVALGDTISCATDVHRAHGVGAQAIWGMVQISAILRFP